MFKLKRLLIKLLNKVGLTTIEKQRLAEQRAAASDEYARLVTAKAEDSGDMIVSGDNTMIRDVYFAPGRRLIVAPWVSYTSISGLYFQGDKK